MKIYLVYLTLLVFWVENSLGFELEKVLGFQQGASLRNINLFILLIAWIIGFRIKHLFYFDKINFLIFILCFIMLISIPLKILVQDIDQISYLSEFASFKHWINPWIFFFLLYNIVDQKEICEKSITALIVLLFLIVITVLVELYGGVELGTTGEKLGRSAGFAEANQFAAYLVLMTPLILSHFFLQTELTAKVKKGLLLFMIILALISTVSRGGYIAFIVSIIAFLALSYKQRMMSVVRIFSFVIIILSFAGISYFLTPDKVKSMAHERVEISQTKRFEGDEYAAEHSWIWKYSSGRSEIWLNGLKYFVQSPIFGHGFSADRSVLKIKPHNSFLMYLINYGVIGFFVFVFIFYYIFKRIYYGYKTTSSHYSKQIYLGFLAGFFGYLVAMFGVDIYIPRYIFWIYAAIVYRYAILEAAESAKIQDSATA